MHLNIFFHLCLQHFSDFLLFTAPIQEPQIILFQKYSVIFSKNGKQSHIKSCRCLKSCCLHPYRFCHRTEKGQKQHTDQTEEHRNCPFISIHLLPSRVYAAHETRHMIFISVEKTPTSASGE